MDSFLEYDIMLSALYAVARQSIRMSVRPSVTRVDQSETVEVRIFNFHLMVGPSL